MAISYDTMAKSYHHLPLMIKKDRDAAISSPCRHGPRFSNARHISLLLVSHAKPGADIREFASLSHLPISPSPPLLPHTRLHWLCFRVDI